MANIIYLEQPVRTGFSYSRIPLIDKPSDKGEAKRIHEFLQKWLSKHPQYLSNPFYPGGSSYSGKVVPALVQEISKGNYICCKPSINLQGYVQGNPITDLEFEFNYRIPFAHGMALISDELYESLKKFCKGKYGNVDSQNIECLKFIENYNKITTKINQNNILLPDCDMSSPDCFLYSYSLLQYWANDESVREALRVNKESIGKWERCHDNSNSYYFNIKSSVPYHMNNSIHGYRSLIFNGDHDMSVPFISTQEWIRSLNFSITDDWRPWMINNQVAGYTRTYANKMTFATIKGGGHTAEYKPEETFIMFQRWISGQAL